ncbi:hypothetical protein K432DRAFT_416901 [Lepidopterella palustris CBS 459.81]|uniref:Uncharacterized protein n=1 Tax=Lepidopterella palustris CBS 459.81 TaxID=1314670 RepID=A0A8E2JF08_9PEZI|nr:hypothetical protein K432DRAFT_416901 [Lepidopterella palustris CBS 459.81]
MPPVRPHLSITLPRNFTFHYTDGQGPKTPEPEDRDEIQQPPGPPRQTYRVRRRRAAIPTYERHSIHEPLTHDDPIPTIEAPENCTDESVALPETLPIPIKGFLAPEPPFARLMSPPKTPLAQISIGDLCGYPQTWEDMDSSNLGDNISRPTSACSGISDSSASSRGSLESFPSFGGSCTSPESDAADPFTYQPKSMKYKGPPSPLHGYQQHRNKKIKLRQETVWSEDMDNHLWMAYMRYLQDPTVTPFKMLPGTAPPLGVCHRVVRDAKKTWKGPRASPTSCTSSQFSSQHASRAGSPDTIKPTKSGSSTPIANDARRPYPKWPRSESETRRRLRHLCKRKPSLSAHYQRLLHCRSPSPFGSSPRSNAESRSGGLSSPFSDHMSSFSTRDMNISLSTSTAATMQYGNPLSQLTSDATPRALNEDWFGQPVGRSSAHQKSQSLHLGLGIGNMLGSPFHSSSPMTGVTTSSSTQANNFNSSTQRPRLDPPLELHSPMPLPRSFKRRALHQFEDENNSHGSGMRHNLLQELFGAPAESSHRRVRSRGFSLGDMGEGARRLSSLFTPPSAFDQMVGSDMNAPAPAPETNLQPPISLAQSTIRLGSPFGGRSSNVYFNNTFPRNFTPHGFEAATSFEHRLGEIPSDSISKDEMQTQN